MIDRRFLTVSLAVQSVANEPAANPTEGTQYIVGSSGTGAFAGISANTIARYNGSEWKFAAPKAGSLEVLNISTGEILGFNGTAWVVVSSINNGGGYEPLAPVLAIVPTGNNLPASASAGDAFLNTSDAKLYTATAANTWDAGTATTNGSRYASSTDFKIYQSDGAALTAINIADGDLFLNKEEESVYVYDASASAFVKVNGASVSQVWSTEIHTLTASEASSKSFTLANSIATGQETGVILSVCGIIQAPGTDFTASGNSISWTNKGLANIDLTAGDVFIVHYEKA